MFHLFARTEPKRPPERPPERPPPAAVPSLNHAPTTKPKKQQKYFL